MIEHLSYCIKNYHYVGYVNLIMTLLESYDINVSDHEHLKLQTNHFIQPRTLESWNLCVVDGKTDFIVKKPKKAPRVVHEEVEEKEDEKEEEQEKKQETASKSQKKKGNVQGTQGRMRKSLRLATNSAAKPTSFTVILDDDEAEKEEKEPAVKGGLFGAGLGFGGFSSSASVMEELKSIKGSVAKLMASQNDLSSRMGDIETVLGNLCESSTTLTKELRE